MLGRKAWTQEEDKILRLLKEQRLESKWSEIARKMSAQFNIKGRTGKQCRERYQNHLNNQVVKAKWTAEEQKMLEKAHNEIGNKWVLIAKNLPGRSDNCVKNHFYSKLRRGMRQLNKYIQKYFHKEKKIIKLSLLSKIIEESEKHFENPEKETVILSIKIKNALFRSQFCEIDQQMAKEQAEQLVEMIQNLEAKLKKQSKRHKQSLETNYQQSKAQQICENQNQQSIYLIFKRVCDEIMLQPK